MQQPLNSAGIGHARIPALLPSCSCCSEVRSLPQHSSLRLARKSRLPTCQPICATGFGASKPKSAPAAAKRKKSRSPDDDVAIWETEGNRKTCPCGSGSLYEVCCQQYHDGAIEPSAEALMRARFSAWVKKDSDYLVATTHPDNIATGGSKRNGETVSTFRQNIMATMAKVRWLRLKVMRRKPGKNEDEAYVGFKTFFKFTNQQGERQKGTRTQTMTELSRFVRDSGSGRWLYIDGDTDWKPNLYGEREPV